jgi:hypothetical protein
MAEVLPIAEPNADAMRQHIEHLFWYEYRDGEFDGQIEMAWTDAIDHKLRHAALFGLAEIDALIEKAVEINSVPNQNVYLGVALRQPETNPLKRANDKDFLSLKCAYADLDVEGAANDAAAKYHGVQPTFVVVTGEHPHFRAHLYWRLDEPIRDPQEYRETIGLIAENFNGDPAVTNPSRVMRLGGSVAWPLKKGRKVEATQVFTFNDGRAESYPKAALQTAWKDQKFADLDVAVGGNIDAEACAEAIRRGENLHINTRNLIAKRVGEGLRDEQIQEEAEALLTPVSDGKTLKQIPHFIETARKKYGVREPEPVVTNMIIANQWEGLDPSPREWIVEDWVPANHVTGVYGDGGIGKTLVVQQLLTAVASGEPWLGMDVKPSKAFGFLCEDFENDIHITQQAINRDLGITMRSLGDLAFMSRVGEDNVLMSFDKSDTGMLTPLYYELVSSIKDFGAKVVVIDTLADTFGGSENVRTQARQFVANCLGRMAREIGGTVIVCGHPSIAGMQSGQGYGGSTAWNNTFRSRLYLTRPEDDGDNNARTLERKKANYASTGEPLQLLWADGVLGLAEQKQTSGGPTNNVSLDLARTILTEIEAKWNAKKPYSSANNTGERYVGKMIQKNFKLKKKVAQELVHAWWQNGVIDDQVVDTHTKLKGLKVTKWPG